MIETHANILLKNWIFVLVKTGEQTLLPYTKQARDTIASSNHYPPAFDPFLNDFLNFLGQSNWPPGTYYPGGWYRNQLTLTSTPQVDEITWDSFALFYQEQVLVDTRGAWFIGQQPITGKVLDFFLKNLEFDPIVNCYRICYPLKPGFEMRYIRHDSPPFRVRQLYLTGDTPMLHLNNGRTEPLNLSSLRMGSGENLYCAIGPTALPAIFEDKPRWQLLQHVEETPQGWEIHLKNQVVELSLDLPPEFSGGVGMASDAQP